MISSKEKYGMIVSWAFIIGIIISIIIGLLAALEYIYLGTDTGGYIALFLAALGVIIGLTSVFGMGSITKEEVPTFLIAGIALLAIAAATHAFTGVKLIGSLFISIAKSIAIFIVPAMGIISLKTMWDIGKKR